MHNGYFHNQQMRDKVQSTKTAPKLATESIFIFGDCRLRHVNMLTIIPPLSALGFSAKPIIIGLLD